jgi:hypothetical protein
VRSTAQNANDRDDDKIWSIEPYQATVFVEQDGEIVDTRISSEDSIAGNVDYITQFVKKLLTTRRSLFSLVPVETVRKERPNTLRIKATRGGECFLRCLRMDLDRIIDKYPSIGKFNRYFGIFYDAVICEVASANGTASFATIARLTWLNGRDRDFFADDLLTLFAGHSNEAIAQIRREGGNAKFAKWLQVNRKLSQENEERVLSLLDAFFSVNHHALVLRFDLGYAQRYCDPELSGEMAVSYEEMREHRVVLRRFLKRELKNRLQPGACKGMVSAVKLEFGLDKWHHFHAIVVLNGNVVREDGRITKIICDHWKREITQGRGGAFNCNARTYTRKGIGSIRPRKEFEKLKILRETVVPYITKTDFYAKMVKPDGHRTLWLSHPPKIPATPKGRKRAVNDEDVDFE